MIAPSPALTRRTILALAATAAITPAPGQSPPVVAWLSIYPLEQVDRYLQAFRAGLLAQGFVDGRNVRIVATISAATAVSASPRSSRRSWR
jgi:putative ABC transport system substrate-binding protein